MADNDKTTYLPSEMAEEIRGIQESLNEIYTNKQSVNFYDYDGSLLYSYSPEAFLLLTEMPPNPSHEGLIAQGWNWELQDAKDYVVVHRALTIGQMYTTDDGKTRIYVRIDTDVMRDRGARQAYSVDNIQPDSDFFDFYLDLSFSYEDDGLEHYWSDTESNPCAIIDWGDGTIQEAYIDGNHSAAFGPYYWEWNPFGKLYPEKTFRYTHNFKKASNAEFNDYVITIEVLHKYWRGRLGFSLNDFEKDDDFGYYSTTPRANAPQFIQKIELGDYMDLATHPDILRPGSFFDDDIISGTATEMNAFTFSNESSYTVSVALSELLNTDFSAASVKGGYLYVMLVGQQSEPFSSNGVNIDLNIACKNTYSIKPLGDVDRNFRDIYGCPLRINSVLIGYATDANISVTNIFSSDNCVVYTNRLFEIDFSMLDELPSTTNITISTSGGPLLCLGTYGWIPKPENLIPYTWENYLYSLKSITLPKDLKSIGNVCFKNSHLLQHVTVPPEITEIPCGVFANNYSLKSLSLPLGIQKIGAQALAGCRRLANVSFPDTLISIGAGAFDGCDSLATPANLTNILHGITYQDDEGSTIIPEELFRDCTDITEVVIPAGTKKISDRAFKNCSALKVINIPLIIEEIGDEAFCGCASLIGGEGAFFVQEPGELGSLFSITQNSMLRSLGKSAFKGCHLLQHIEFPSGISVLPDSVCEDCQSLNYVKIPSYVQTIGKRAFYDCKSLITVVFNSNSVDTIDDYAFSGCRLAMFSVPSSNDANVGLPDFITYIGKRAFEKTSLRHVTIPYAITELNEGTFSECKLLETVSFVRDLLEYELYGRTVYHIQKIGPYAFYSTLLKSILIPDSVIEIGAYAFAACWRLKNVTLPSNLYLIADHVFESTVITSMQLPNSVASIGNYAFSDCTELKLINLPNNVTTIGDYAFKNCVSLESLALPNSLTHIGEGSFMNASKLVSITIPRNVEAIGDYAFAITSPQRSHLESISFLSIIPPTVEGEHVWEGLPTTCVIHVPAHRLGIYESANNYPDPNVYTYVADQPDNDASIEGYPNATTLVLTGPSVNIVNNVLEFTHDFASLDDDILNMTY